MSAVALLRRRLEKHPSIALSAERGGVSVKPTSAAGFEVSLLEETHETFVFFEGWHEHFESPEEAVNCFLFGLSSRCRIRVQRRGGYAHHWTLESNESGAWVPYSETGLFFFPLWRRPEVTYLQNSHID